MEEDKKPDKHSERIEKEIEKIGQRMERLESSVQDEELTPAERMEFAIKLRSQYISMIRIQRASELSMPEGREKELLAVFMSRLRGEVTDG
jgi:uncharacterized protein YnzC (UPF0291/DUF896 family)